MYLCTYILHSYIYYTCHRYTYIAVATLCLPSVNVLQTLDISNLNLIIDTGCPKKMGLVFRGQFRPLYGRKSKKARKQTPPKIQFYLLGGV